MDSLMPPAFDVDLSKISEPLDNPHNGEEYLKNVIFERHYYPTVLSAPVNVGKLNNKQNVFVSPNPKVSISEKLKPTMEWQTLQEADFSEVRCNVSKLYNTKEMWPLIKNLPSISKDTPDKWRQFIEENLPQLSLVFTLRQYVLEHLLDIMITGLDDVTPGIGLSRNYGLWIYAILASLKLPLTPELCSSLRDLARKCQLIRSKLNPDEDTAEQTAMPLNLFICLVARYFRQVDISD